MIMRETRRQERRERTDRPPGEKRHHCREEAARGSCSKRRRKQCCRPRWRVAFCSVLPSVVLWQKKPPQDARPRRKQPAQKHIPPPYFWRTREPHASDLVVEKA